MHPSSAGFVTTPSRARRHARVIAGLLFGALAAGTVVSATPVAHAADPVTINLVTINDFHGRIENEGTGSRAAGAAALSTAVKGIRATNPNTVFAAAGDLIGASTFTSFIQQDNPTIDALNAAGLEVSAVGNHEFDQGYTDLISRVIPRAAWKYLGANVETTDTAPELDEYFLKTMAGVTVGFVGVVTDELPSLVSPAGIANLTIEAPVTAANRVAGQLSDGNTANGEADIVVLLVHEGAATTNIASATDPASRFGQLVNGASAHIDAIVSGHTHLAYNHKIPRAGLPDLPVISSGQYGEKFSNMTISYNPDTDSIISMNNVIIDMKTPPPPTSCSPPAVPCNPVYTDDPAVAPIVASAKAQADVLGNVKVGDVTADFNRAQHSPLVDGVPTPGENRGGESTIGNFVADVQLWSSNQNSTGQPVQIAFMNPGGIRTNLAFAPDGVITYKEAANVQPFANTLMTLTLTGAQVEQVLEQQWQPLSASRPFLKLGVNKEFKYTYDPLAAAGSRITSMTLSGVPIDPAASYRIVANSFLAAGGDNFTALAGGTSKVDTGKVDLQSMVDWFAANKVAAPDPAQRGIGVSVAPDPDGYSTGDPLTINLSSLDFSTNEPKAGTVNVWLSGVAIGSFPVDPTSVSTTDEGGRATIVTTVPPGFVGLESLAIKVPTTGTTIGAGFFTVPPTRVFDTRTDYPQGAVDVTKQKYGAAKILKVKITGAAGVPLGGVSAVSLNLTAAGPVGDGFVTVFPCTATIPTSASLTYVAGDIVGNALIAPVSNAGEVCFYSNVDTDLIADINSWFPSGAEFHAVAPTRVFDTRPDYPQGAVSVTKQKYGAAKLLKVKVTGAAGVPATGVNAVSLNLTAAGPVGAGFVTVFPCSGVIPTSASLTFLAGEIIGNALIAPVSAAGEVCFYSNVETDLIADINSWFSSGAGFHSVAPTRVFDTRPDYPDGAVTVTKQKVGAANILKVKVTGAAGVPTTGVSAVSLNLTATRTSGAGFVTVYPCTAEIPTAASLTYVTGETVSNALIARVSAAGEVCFYSNVSIDLVADVNSWFGL